jgi:membrane protease YdiL (CAAX protease family)
MERRNNMIDKSKKLRSIMATWTVAIFATIFAVVMTVLWIPLYNTGASALAAIGQAFAAGWVMILIALILCVGAYVGYSLYLNNKK